MCDTSRVGPGHPVVPGPLSTYLVVLDSRRPCLVTFADYGRCLHTKCLYLSCANTLQTRYVLSVSVFVDANTKLSDVAVDTEQCI